MQFFWIRILIRNTGVRVGVCIFVKFSLVWTLNILYRGSGEDLVCENANKYHLEIHLGLACGENKFIEVGK